MVGARAIIGVIGNVISFGLFISPAVTFYRILKKKSTEEFHPYPYLCCIMNCMAWIFYGYHKVTHDNLLVVTINGIGLGLEVIYLSIFFFYTNNKNRKIICSGLLIEAILMVGLILFTLLYLHDLDTRKNIVGIVCNVFGIIMYGSPLSIIKTVVQTQSVEYMQFWLCLAGFVNGCVWFGYSQLHPQDLYIAIGNGIGGALGAIQLLVYGYYKFFGKPTNDDAKPKQGEMQLKNMKNLPV